MAVDVERCSCAGVPHPLLDGFDVLPRRDKQARIVMPQIVKTELLRQAVDIGFRLADGALNQPRPAAIGTVFRRSP
jgi:hypothetical protein